MAWSCSCFLLLVDSRSCLLSGVLRPLPGAHPATAAPGPCSRDEEECVTIAFLCLMPPTVLGQLIPPHVLFLFFWLDSEAFHKPYLFDNTSHILADVT